jgi:ABC-type branched-subunit amino acid transport system ATPase component
MLAYMFYTTDLMFGTTGAGLSVPQPSLSWLGLDGDRASYFVVIFLAVLATAFVVALSRARLGRLLRAMSDAPTALATNGVNIVVTRVLVFCISAFLAAEAGALAAMAKGTVSIDSYHPLQSLKYLAVIMIMVGGAPWNAILAALGVVLIPSYITSTEISYWLQLLFGVSAVAFALIPDERLGAPPGLRRLVDTAFNRKAHASAPSARPVEAVARVPPGVLQVTDLTVRFGGIVAVDGITLRAPTGLITGLIGPNGAGKTTTFNACCGLARPSGGRVLLDGRDISHDGVSSRAGRGLGRTFQQMQLFDSMSVWDNVAIGAEGHFAGHNPLTHLFAGPRSTKSVREATAGAIELCNLTALPGVPVGSLSTAQRRLVELARCLAGPYKFLLLDEPSSGLDSAETLHFGEILVRIVEQRGLGILLVEHNVSLVMGVCAYIYVLDFGRMIFEGTPEEVSGSSEVRRAYLAGYAEVTPEVSEVAP